jgi:hypothetical protein
MKKGKNFNEISPTSSDFQIQVDPSWSEIGTVPAMPTIVSLQCPGDATCMVHIVLDCG